MYIMNYDISLGGYKLRTLISVSVKKSVQSISNSARIVLTGNHDSTYKEDIRQKIREGAEVIIKLGYNESIYDEFHGFISKITDSGKNMEIECEDGIYLFRKALADEELKEISVEDLLKHVTSQIDSSFSVTCSYDFKYEKYVIAKASGWDILKKIQEETKANIYFKDHTLHMHAPYEKIFNDKAVIYDTTVNIEKSALVYKDASERKYEIEIESILESGERIKETAGTPGGEKRSFKIFGVSDPASMKKKAEEELKNLAYSGYEGNFTGWLLPFCDPGYKITLQDKATPEKNGNYYVTATETTFSSAGGVRVITIGKKL